MPIFLALIFLSFLPCIIRMVQRFLLDHMSAIANQKFNQLYLQGYQPLQNHPENYREGPIQDTTGA
jgi:tyrosine-protein phosphatase YwqE